MRQSKREFKRSLSITVKPSVYDELRTVGHQVDRSVSDIIRELIEVGLPAFKKRNTTRIRRAEERADAS